MVFIYALQLEEGKYYIGKTNNPDFRLENHFHSNGSEWTKRYKPKKIVEIIPNCDDYDEDKYTRKYMDKYGINNVRGGSFVSMKLDKSTIDILKHMSNGTNNKCFVCGKDGHFAKDCDVEEYEYIWCCNYCDKEFTEEQSCEKHEKYCQTRNKKVYTKYDSDSDSDSDDECFRCGRCGHYASACYAVKHINGYYL